MEKKEAKLTIWWMDSNLEPTVYTVSAWASTPGGLAFVHKGERKWALIPWHRIAEVERGMIPEEMRQVYPPTNTPF